MKNPELEVVPLTEPFHRFAEALSRAEATGMADPNAMVVSSVDREGAPSSRVVLLKGHDERGFVFYTNFESRKGREILADPRVSLNFFWREIDQQVRIEGIAEQVSDSEADTYFASRSRGSRIGAWASAQSRYLADRSELEAAVEEAQRRFPGEVPRPPHWSGFRVVPQRIEIWIAGKFRLHDRTIYERKGTGWRTFKIFP